MLSDFNVTANAFTKTIRFVLGDVLGRRAILILSSHRGSCALPANTLDCGISLTDEFYHFDAKFKASGFALGDVLNFGPSVVSSQPYHLVTQPQRRWLW